MPPTDLEFSYEPAGGGSELDAYDAGKALSGIARSVSLVAHYVVNEEIIKQAPYMRGAKLLLKPLKQGSFVFSFDMKFLSSTPSSRSSINALFNDTLQFVYARAVGKAEQATSSWLQGILRTRPGDLDALNDAIDADVVSIHRPFEGDVTRLLIQDLFGQIAIFNHATYEFVVTERLVPDVQAFVGNIASYNGNTDGGRIWIAAEGRTVPFRRDRDLRAIDQGDRRLLSWSLDQYVNKKDGTIRLMGKSLTNREGKLKMIFATGADIVRA